ncbi:MAG: alpha/beta fold hydrolase [Pseudomonadota bacterium]
MNMDFRQIERQKYAISPQACEWTMRAMGALRSRLEINIKLHGDREHLAAGDIFMFNHFARFETFIPQYLIAAETGVYCRSVASGEFFTGDSRLGRYLASLGGVPNDYPRLLPFLAEEILRGGKVVIFPEGGMVKDRRVLRGDDHPGDKKQDYSIYSKSADQRRAHHSGAAILAMALDGFKAGLGELIDRKPARKDALLEQWATRLEMSPDALHAAILRPTLVFPANITFHPLRMDQNLLAWGADMFSGGLSPRMAEEMLIEGNLLLRRTDMDIRLGDPMNPRGRFNWFDRKMLAHNVAGATSLDDLFRPPSPGLRDRVMRHSLSRHIVPFRDQGMAMMYANLTLNVSHLASRLIMMLITEGINEVDIGHFDKTLYLAIKNAQNAPDIHLHRGMRNPASYIGIFDRNCPQIRQFIDIAVTKGLIERREGRYCFLPKLQAEADFHQIRMDNPVMVYANEMAPIRAAWDALITARQQVDTLSPTAMAQWRFDDEMRSWQWNHAKFQRPKFAAINDQETASADARPYLHLPPGDHCKTGILVVHGFLASPAELRSLGDRLAASGHAVMGVRLSGHGTSPHDLQKRRWSDWLASVRRGYDILSPFCDRIIMVGFSTGGALSAIHAASHPEKLAGLVLAATPLKFRNRNLMFVPLLYGANKLVGWMPSAQEMLGFRLNESEHPDINYRNIPIQGLHNLRQAVAEMNRRLADIQCPLLILQGDEDTVVDPASASMIARRTTGTTHKTVTVLRSTRHGILNEDIDGAVDHVVDFVTRPDPS